MLAMAALTFFASPLAAQASNITTKDGETLTAKNKVYNIEVQKKLSSSVGVNKFKDFTLDKGQIANLQFDKLNTLANLVDNKISINGTVNALRDGKIGGNLYFLSPNGIAVGASGVINAGRFTGMAVDESYFDKLSGLKNAGEFMTKLAPKNIKYNYDAEKGIDIQGVINAPGGINLYASNIKVGSGAVLRTDVSSVNFKDVVNITSKGKTVVNAGFTGELDASYSNGDIVLKAVSSYANRETAKEIDDPAKDENGNIIEGNATINVDGTLRSAKDISIVAEATINSEGDWLGTATQNPVVKNLFGNIGLDIGAGYIDKKNIAVVNIGKSADIYSKGDTEISAVSTIKAKSDVEAPKFKTGSTNATDWLPAAASVSVINVTNMAVVNVNGKVTSEGTTKVNAKSTVSATAAASTKTGIRKSALEENGNLKEEPHYIAVGILTGENDATVNVNKSAEIISNEKDVEIQAKVSNTLSNSAVAATIKESSDVVANDQIATTTAVNVTVFDSSATTNIDGYVEAKNGSVKLEALNDIKNTLSTSTQTGASPKSSDYWYETVGDPGIVDKLSLKLFDKIGSKFSSLADKQSNDMPQSSDDSTLSKIFNGKYLKTGISVGVLDGDNSAKVNVGKTANVLAKKDVDVNAKTIVKKLRLKVTSTVNNKSQKQDTKSMIGVGVLVSDIDNDADILVDGSLTAKGNVNVKTDSGMNYNQFKAVIEDIKTTLKTFGDKIVNEAKNVKGVFTKYKSQIEDELDDLENANETSEYLKALDNLNEKVNDTTDTGFDAVMNTIFDGLDLYDDFESLPAKLTSIISPSSYANYYARSAFGDNKSANDETASKLDAAGSISINSMNNNSRILVNNGANIKADSTVEINPLAKNRVVAITGNGGEYLTSSSAANAGAGISVMVGNFDNNAVVNVGKAKIESNDININSKDYSKHINIIYGNGKADSTSITGMVSYINSPTDSIISIDDSAKLKANNELNLTANGEDYITSVNGAITLGNGNGKSFGAAVNVLSNDKNTVVKVGDNGVLNSDYAKNIEALESKIKSLEDNITAESEKSNPDKDKLLAYKADLQSLQTNKQTHEILGEDSFKKLDTSAVNSDGLLSAKSLTVTADKTGVINSIAIEGTENSESHGMMDNFNKGVGKGTTYLSNANDVAKATPELVMKFGSWVIGKIKGTSDKSGQPNPEQATKKANADTNPVNNDINNNEVTSQLNVAGAGSGAINLVSGNTSALISNAIINADSVNVNANNDAFHGTWAGAGAFNFFGNSQASKNTNVAIGGAVAYTGDNKNVNAIIKNSNINAASIKNIANRADADVAAAMGLAVSTNSGDQGTNVDVAISASIDLVDGDTHALLLDNTVKGGSIENKATIDSVQVAGGLDIAGSTSGGKGFNIGGSAAASQINNDLQSGISGGSYENLGKVDITANKKSNQVDVAVAGGITAGSDTKGFSFGGAIAISDINNNSRAFIDNTSKFNASGVVNVDALDTKNSGSRDEYLSARSINTDPTSFLDGNDKGKVDGTNGGGNIVNVALGGGASTGEAGAGGIGFGYAGMSNIMNVDISNNQAFSAKNLNANTTNKSNIVNVTMGLAGSNKSFSAAGSFGVSDIKNDGTINIKNSNVSADSFLSGTNSSAHIVNVAGQAALANKFAGGLTFAYNAMNNTTGINVQKGTWNVKDFGANATNDNYALAIAAGVAFSKETAALNGAIGLNFGNNSTKSIVDGLTLNGIKNAKLTATDNTSKTTVAGGVTITKDGKVAAGGAVAYADIGTSDNKEVINAKIVNSKISAENNSSIDVEALDNAKMTTVAVGVGGAISGAVATFQGASAVSEVNKENVAEISDTDITDGAADIKIIATSGGNSADGLNINGSTIDVNNKVKTAAAVLDANFSNESWFDGAFAISVNKFNQSTEANFKNTSRPEILSRAGNVDMFSNSEANILGVALGGAGGGSKVSAAGSVSYNYINNSAKTLVENANVKADKNFGVVAQSDDQIANYAGAVDVDVNGYGSIGVSVAYNEIKGNTNADITKSGLEVGGIAVSKPDIVYLVDTSILTLKRFRTSLADERRLPLGLFRGSFGSAFARARSVSVLGGIVDTKVDGSQA